MGGMGWGGVARWRESEEEAEVSGRDGGGRSVRGGEGEVQGMGAGGGGGEMEAERKKSSGMSSHGEEAAAGSPGSAIGEIGGES